MSNNLTDDNVRFLEQAADLPAETDSMRLYVRDILNRARYKAKPEMFRNVKRWAAGVYSINPTYVAYGDLTYQLKESTTLPFTSSNFVTELAAGTWVAVGADGIVPSFTDAEFDIHDSIDATKIAKFEASGITTETTKTFTFPNQSGVLGLLSQIESYNASFSRFQVDASTTDSDPGVGNMRYNNATPHLSTFIYLSDTSLNSGYFAFLMQIIPAGSRVKLTDITTPVNYFEFVATSIVYASGYIKIGVGTGYYGGTLSTSAIMMIGLYPATVKTAALTNVSNVIAIDCEHIFAFEATNRVAVAAAASITISNAPAKGYITGDIELTNFATSPITFPDGSISGDDRIAARVFTATANGKYTFSIKIVGSEYEVVITPNPAI